MARAACLRIPPSTPRRVARSSRPHRRFLARPSVTLAVMVLAVLAGGFSAAGGQDGGDLAVLAGSWPLR